jgi:diketogulonate reductase-like aldo/keto reductase
MCNAISYVDCLKPARYLDSLVLHALLDTLHETMEAWRVMESFVDTGVVKRIGISIVYDYDFV